MLDESLYRGRFWSNTSEMFTFLHQLAANDKSCSLPAEEDLPFIEWLEWHELAAFAYTRVDTSQALFSKLAPIYWASASANVMKLSSLESLLAALAEAGIRCVLLKGMAFCLTIYPDAAVRPMSDLDLWIQRSDWTRTWQVMKELGYETDKLWHNPRSIPEHVTTLEFYPRQLMKEDFLSVEIHSDLVAHPTHLIGRLPLHAWWDRAYPLVWQGRTVYLLDPAAALLHTAVHQMFQHHGQLRLRWLLDVDQLVRGRTDYYLTEADWQCLSEEALQAGVLSAVQCSLRLCQKWFNTPLPASALDLLSRPDAPRQEMFFRQIVTSQRSTAARVWTDVQGIPHTLERLTLLRQKLLPTSAYMMARYQIPSPLLLPFYYLMRWGKAIQMIWRQQ